MHAQIWKSIILAVIAGLMLGFSQPFYVKDIVSVTPVQDYLGLLSLIGYMPLFWALAEQNLKRCFFLSTLTITVHHTVVLYWIYIALNVHGHIPPLLSSVLTVLISVVLGFMGATFFSLGRYLSQRYNVSFFLIAPIAITTSEYFRNFYLFGGFPWGNIGYSFGRVLEFAQMASVIGVYGLVFLAATINSLWCMALKTPLPRRRFSFVAAGFALILFTYLFGVIRLHGSEKEFAPTIRVALLQGNIPQEVKSSARLYAKDIMQIYLDLMRTAKDAGAELVVWPESSHPKLLNKDIDDVGFDFRDRMASIVGAVVYGENSNGEGYYVHNSGIIMDFRGRVIKRYDKSHLVPFGEYVPWPMSGIVDRIVPGLGAFRPGTEFVPVKLSLSEGKELSIGTTVCYEGIFPEISRAYAQGSADLLVNLTNDAWYGFSSAPYQHLLMYRLRAIEAGLPFVRATNTGVSGWIDVYGREHQTTELFKRDVVIADIPLLRKVTVYGVVGDLIAMLCAFALIIGYVCAVLPVHHFIRQKKWGKLGVMAGLASVVIVSTLYFHRPELLTDESARTKNFFVFLLCLLLMIGLLSRTKRSRSILFVAGSVIVFAAIMLSIFESLYFLVGIVLGLLIYLLAFRIKEDDKLIK